MPVQSCRFLPTDACNVQAPMLLVGSGVVGRRTFEDAAIGDPGLV